MLYQNVDRNGGIGFSSYFSVTERVKKRFDEAGIALPVTQRDVYVHGRSLEEVNWVFHQISWTHSRVA